MATLAGKTALVRRTRGIGRASALALAQARRGVMILQPRRAGGLDEAVVPEIRKGGGSEDKIGADMRLPKRRMTWRKRCARDCCERLDIPVAKAERSEVGTIEARR